MKGIFVTFEGGDGAGKSTQIKKFTAYLEEEGRSFILTREPGGTALGDRIRQAVLDPNSGKVDERAETLLYLASRAQHVDEVIRPALEAGKIVVCDRFCDSTLAYQGIARGLGMDEMRKLNHFATGGLMPDLTFLLDADSVALEERRSRRRVLDRMELEKDGFQERVRSGFLELAALEPERIHKINALDSVGRIRWQIIEIFERYARTHLGGE